MRAFVFQFYAAKRVSPELVRLETAAFHSATSERPSVGTLYRMYQSTPWTVFAGSFSPPLFPLPNLPLLLWGCHSVRIELQTLIRTRAYRT